VKIIPVIELVPLSSGEMETLSDMLSDTPSTAETVWRDTAGKNIVFFSTGQFWDFGIFDFNNMYSFRLVLKKSPKYIFRSLFYYTLSVCACRFLINSTKVAF